MIIWSFFLLSSPLPLRLLNMHKLRTQRSYRDVGSLVTDKLFNYVRSMSPSYRNQSSDSLCKLMVRFPYSRKIGFT